MNAASASTKCEGVQRGVGRVAGRGVLHVTPGRPALPSEGAISALLQRGKVGGEEGQEVLELFRCANSGVVEEGVPHDGPGLITHGRRLGQDKTGGRGRGRVS